MRIKKSETAILFRSRWHFGWVGRVNKDFFKEGQIHMTSQCMKCFWKWLMLHSLIWTLVVRKAVYEYMHYATGIIYHAVVLIVIKF